MSIKTDSRQIEYRQILQTLGLGANATGDLITAALNKELDYPLRPRASLTADARLSFSDAQLIAADNSKKVLGSLKRTIFTAPTNLYIDFQARTVSNATYFDVTFPTSTVGYYRRAAIFFNGLGKIKVAFSAENASIGALVSAGQLLPASNIIPLGYVDLQCTATAGSFKSANAGTNVIVAQDIYRFSPGAGGGGGQGTTFDENQVAHGFALLDAIYFNGTAWVKAQANAANTLASYIVVDVANADQFTAANFGVFEIANALTPGQYYFNSTTVAGSATTTEPATGYSSPLFFVESTAIIHAMVHRPAAIGDGIISDSDIGAIVAFPSISAPTGYLYCDGRAVSRVTYADLYALVGNRYGTGDGSTTFNLPDLRGYYMRGTTQNMGGTATLVNPANDTITIPNHNFQHTGVLSLLTAPGTPGGLTTNTAYYIIVVDANNIKLSPTLTDALLGNAMDITSAGSGTISVSQYEDPDADVRFPRAVGGLSGNFPGSYEDDQFESHNHQDATGNVTTTPQPNAYNASSPPLQYFQSSTTGNRGGTETRGKNMSVCFFIRFAPRAAVKGDSVPSGTMLTFGGSLASIPAGYLACDGSSLLRSDFPKLFAAIGTAWGSTDGATTFNIPETRGFFLRGVDGLAGRDPDATSRTAANVNGNVGNNVGSVQGDVFGAHNHRVTLANTGGSVSLAQYVAGDAVADEATTTVGGNETRPKNVYVNYIIKV